MPAISAMFGISALGIAHIALLEDRVGICKCKGCLVSVASVASRLQHRCIRQYPHYHDLFLRRGRYRWYNFGHPTCPASAPRTAKHAVIGMGAADRGTAAC